MGVGLVVVADGVVVERGAGVAADETVGVGAEALVLAAAVADLGCDEPTMTPKVTRKAKMTSAAPPVIHQNRRRFNSGTCRWVIAGARRRSSVDTGSTSARSRVQPRRTAPDVRSRTS